MKRIDKRLQNSLVIKRLLKNPDFKVFTTEIQELFKEQQSDIKNLVENIVKPKDLDKLNSHIAQRNALGAILLTKDTLEEELESILDESSEGENDENNITGELTQWPKTMKALN